MENQSETQEGPPPRRWEVELEFVQSLANPMYVHFLAQNKYLEDPAFLNYLKYLEYWRKPESAKYIVYPNCLHMLKLLQQPRFREEICRVETAKMIMDDFYSQWAAPEEPSDPATSADPDAAGGVKAEENSEVKQEP